MTALLVVSLILSLIIRLYIAVLWGRFIVDWVRVLNPSFRPKGFLAVLIEAVFVLTDPPIKFFRRVLPTLRIGQVQLDLGWFLTLLSCWILLAFLR